MNRVVVLVVLCMLSACSSGSKVRTVDVGEIQKVEIIAGGWGSPPRLVITTEKEVVLIDDVVSVPLGVHCYYDYYSKGYRRVWWDGGEFSYRASSRTPVD